MTTAESTSRRRACGLALGVALVWLAVAVPLLGDHGPGWDSVVGDLPFGERLVAYLETGDPAFLNNSATTPQPRRAETGLFLDGPRFPSAMVYPLGALCCGLTSRIFTTELGVLGPIAGFHLAIVLFAASTFALVAYFGARRGTLLVGVLAASFLAAQPRWLGHAFDNPKDVPETALYFATCIAGLGAIVRGGMLRWTGVGALAGLGLAQKANIVFAAPQLLVVWWLCARLGVAAPAGMKRNAQFVLVALATAFVVCVAVSPDVWSRPITGVYERLAATAKVGHGLGGSALAVSFAPTLDFLATTPLSVLLCAVVGAWFGRVPRHVRAFLVVGVAVPVVRVQLPGMQVFDGVRHFLEFAPFLAVLAALGAHAIGGKLLATRSAGWRAAAALVCTVPGLAATVALHPYQTVFFNPAVGGFGGAQAREWVGSGDYWGNSYLHGAQWLSAHAERDAHVVVPIAGHVFDAIAPLALRDDIATINGFAPPTTGVLYVLVLSRLEPRGAFVVGVVESAPLVHSIRAQGGSVLDVYRIELGASTEELLALHRDESVRLKPIEAMLDHFAREPRLAAEFNARLAAQPDKPLHEHVEDLREHVPPHLAPAVSSLVEYLDSLGEDAAHER